MLRTVSSYRAGLRVGPFSQAGRQPDAGDSWQLKDRLSLAGDDELPDTKIHDSITGTGVTSGSTGCTEVA